MSSADDPTSGKSHGAPRVGRAASSAAGFASLRTVAEHLRRQTTWKQGARALLSLNQSRGFDCPGCAWPDPAERATFEFCENGAKALLDEATNARVTPEFFDVHSIADLFRRPERWLNAQGRITEPMLRRPGRDHYESVAWDEAFELIAAELAALEHPDQAVFYTSGRTSNEAAFLYQLLARTFGTNNLPDCSNLCHESSGAALKETIGVGKGTVTLDDFTQADAIFVVGQNPGTNHPRMLSALRAAKTSGASIVSVNPLKEVGLVRFRHPQKAEDLLGDGVALADHFVRVRVNGDLALFRGLNKALLDLEARRPGRVLSHAFIRDSTRGFEEFASVVRATSWEHIVELSGVEREQIEAIAELYARAQRTICCWAMGITQHKNAVATIQELTAFLLLRGNLGRPGAGACPVRGHSNVQGDRTVGISSSMPEWFHARLDELYAVATPRRPGLDTVGAIEAMANGRARVFVALGGNFLSASPDTEYTARALRRCRLTVHVSTKLNRSHFAPGDMALILPCIARSEVDDTGHDASNGTSNEQLVSVENSMGIVHASRGTLPKASPHLRSEAEIVARIAHGIPRCRNSGARWLHWIEDYDRIRAQIEATIPGFEAYNERLRQPGGFVLPNAARDRVFQTASGRAEFRTHELSGIRLEPGQFLLTTLRSHDQFNTTVYTDDDRYRGIYGHRRVLLIHPDDLRARGLEPGMRVTITSHHAGQERHAKGFSLVPYDIPRGCVASYFPEANVLVPLNSYADVSRTPTSKSLVVTLAAE